jgi:hypothetical protein
MELRPALVILTQRNVAKHTTSNRLFSYTFCFLT